MKNLGEKGREKKWKHPKKYIFVYCTILDLPPGAGTVIKRGTMAKGANAQKTINY